MGRRWTSGPSAPIQTIDSDVSTSETGAAIEEIRLAAVTASESGALVIPGAETGIRSSAPTYRSGSSANTTIEQALASLSAKFAEGDRDPDAAYWLVAGYIATGQRRTGSRYVEAARDRFPDDVRFVILDAMLAYQANELHRAEHLLRAALAQDPSQVAAAYNLAVVLVESAGDGANSTAEVAELVRRVQRAGPGSALSRRAGQLLAAD